MHIPVFELQPPGIYTECNEKTKLCSYYTHSALIVFYLDTNFIVDIADTAAFFTFFVFFTRGS